jgi:protease-4
MESKKISFSGVFWPSLVAVLVASVVSLILFFLMLGGIIGSFEDFSPPTTTIEDNTILHMSLKGDIGEKSETKLNPGTFQLEKKTGLSAILHGIDHAKKDSRIKGLFLELDDLNCGFATAREIRNALKEFKKSGKFIVAYNKGEVITQRDYYLSSVASEVYCFPTSVMEFTGLGAELTFFKGTLEMLDVEVEIIRGKNNDFKSAVEPFFLKEMSDSSRVQINRYLQSIWLDIRQDISTDRGVSIVKLNEIADNMLIRKAKDAKQFGMVDDVKYRDEVIDLLKKRIKLAKGKELKMPDFNKYAKSKFLEDQLLTKSDEPNIAVIVAEGEVSTDGEGLSSKEICKLFQDVRANKSIKAVVFRINSPGGSALASDEIWREVELTRKKMKVIVSMGDVAASGGYYIAAPAHRIFAEPTTITGSIGVFGMIPYTGKMLENKLGISFDRAGTNRHSVLSLNRKLTPEELNMMQEEVDDIYSDFLNRVSTGRKMTTSRVNAVARGRVWTGTDAIRIGLVDELGGLVDAVEYAAKQIGVKKGKVLYYPLVEEDKLGDFLEMLEESELDQTETQSAISEELLLYYKRLRKLENMRGMQMRMPFDVILR